MPVTFGGIESGLTTAPRAIPRSLPKVGAEIGVKVYGTRIEIHRMSQYLCMTRVMIWSATAIIIGPGSPQKNTIVRFFAPERTEGFETIVIEPARGQSRILEGRATNKVKTADAELAMREFRTSENPWDGMIGVFESSIRKNLNS